MKEEREGIFWGQLPSKISVLLGLKLEKNASRHKAHLRTEYGKFQGKGFKLIQQQTRKKCKAINNILYPWIEKCESSGVYVNGQFLKEEAINIEEGINQEVLNELKISEGRLEKLKLNYGIREKQISGKLFDVSETTAESWIKRLRELCKGYLLKDV